MDAVTAERLRARIEAHREEAVAGSAGARSGAPGLDRAISRMLGEIDDVTGRWARFACASNGDPLGSHRDDVHNLIRIEVAAVLRTMIVQTQTAQTQTHMQTAQLQIRNLAAYLRRIATRTAYAYFHSAAFTGLGGGSGPARRSGTIHSTRREFAMRHGRAPSDTELVDEVNRHARATRRDPVKQGALITVADVRTAEPVSLDALPLDVLPLSPLVGAADEIAVATTATPAVDAPDAPLERIDAERLITRTLEVCGAVSTPLGTAARLWIGDALAAPPVIGTADEIAAHLRIAPAAAEDLLAGCRTVASLIANAEFDLSSPFG